MKDHGFVLDNDLGYFVHHGVQVMAFDDIYPAGHQSGVSILMHGRSVATNGDIRFEPTPGQWQPVPRQVDRKIDSTDNSISTKLVYPDMDNHLHGFNPIVYPDIELSYEVKVTGEKEGIRVTVNFDEPLPTVLKGKVHFIFELFPGDLIGKPWIMDDQQGIFPAQPNGPVAQRESVKSISHRMPAIHSVQADRRRITETLSGFNPLFADDLVGEPYAVGNRFTVRPDEPLYCFTVQSYSGKMSLYDGRMNHNNGWFVLAGEVPEGKKEKAVEWFIQPHIDETWSSTPVIQVSQVGYLPRQPKVAYVELDKMCSDYQEIALEILDEHGFSCIEKIHGEKWGRFLRYQYLKYDFTHIKDSGLYRIRYGKVTSHVFRIGENVFDRGVWQPVLEYFLPVQMCHMRVNEKYRVWHDRCHLDDAVMAPVNTNHFDGYVQGATTLTKYKSGEHVPGLNAGGWHDAGDFDLRIESQTSEMYILSLAYDAFNVEYDTTSIDQINKIAEIHQPDGKNDILQQIEHGALSVSGGYHSLDRLYRGIICNDLRQYVLLGDSAAMTDNISNNSDDRWVFTEDNPIRELTSAAHLAAASQALKDYKPDLSADLLDIAQELFLITRCENETTINAKVHAAVELYLATANEEYCEYLYVHSEHIFQSMERLGWIIARCYHKLKNPIFKEKALAAFKQLAVNVQHRSSETPYGIPYRPHIWGAGWDIQRIGFEQYFLHKALPDVFDGSIMAKALDFVLGCHPGSNTVSFASGVGANSATTAYGLNRADFFYIPGGVISGTALIRPDFPELLTWPYLWQQTEYVLGGGSSHYMFLVLAVIELYKKKS